MKKLSLIILSALMVISLVSCTAEEAKIYGVAAAEIEKEAEAMVKRAETTGEIGMNLEVPEKIVAVKAIIKKLAVMDECKKNGIELTEEEKEFAKGYIENQFNEMKKGIEDGFIKQEDADKVFGDLKKYLEANGLTEEEYVKLAEEQIIYSTLYQKLADKVYDNDLAKMEEYLNGLVEGFLENFKED